MRIIRMRIISNPTVSVTGNFHRRCTHPSPLRRAPDRCRV